MKDEIIYESKLNYLTLAELKKQPPKEFEMLTRCIEQILVSGKKASINEVATAVFFHEANVINKQYKGLHWNDCDKRWVATRCINGKKHWIIKTRSKEEAIKKLIEFCKDHGLTW